MSDNNASAPNNRTGMKRRDLLLSTTTMLAASALSAAGLGTPAQALSRAKRTLASDCRTIEIDEYTP
jgi:hypothetical protein